MGKKALVLSGGSIKGAFEAGAVKALFEQGFQPDMVTGISIGALNSAFIVNRIGQLDNQFQWTQIGEDLINFWLNHASSPQAVMRKNSFIKIAYQLLTKRFVSLLDMSPFHNLMKRTLSTEALRKAKVDLVVGAVNLYTGQIEYFSQKDDFIVDAVIASSSIPILMPYINIKGVPYVDGGVRDVLPVQPLFSGDDIEEIIMVVCHPERLSEENFDPGNLIKYVNRTKNITVNELVKSDIDYIIEYNKKQTKAKRPNVKYKVIRPEKEIMLTLDKFTRQDIQRLIDWGYQRAMASDWLA